ncbi:hypothetical protein [Tautonia rosea]|uniref:hypothetical protein n=1 Tax=Tautonia rosea TaxID=2728037 RepID=UPI0014732696|nr:hypothetical protein [Tautonia rosea]
MSTAPSFSSRAIPERWIQIVEAIVNAPYAWSTPDDVIEATGIDEEALIDELADMDIEGWIDVWERPDGLVVTLSVLAAKRFGCHLIEIDPPRTLRWAREGEAEPPPQVTRSTSMAPLFAIIDPHPGPEFEIEANERAARYQANGRFGTFRRGAGQGEPPRPTLLLGSNLSGWSGSQETGSDVCPACQSRPLPAHAYCLCCDRWGLDAPDWVPSHGGRTRKATTRNAGDARYDQTDRPSNPHRPPLIRLRSERNRRERLVRRDRLRNQRPT